MNTNMELARTQMVTQQVRAWDVLDETVLGVLATVPRERFVPEHLRTLAFADMNIPLPCGQYMMTPQVEGRMLQALGIRPTDSILEVGTGSGFMTACLARLGQQVTSLEIQDELAKSARRILREIGVRNAEIVTGDVYQWQSPATCDVVAVTGSVPAADDRFLAWLKPGGRLFIITGELPVMEACLVTRLSEHEYSTRRLFETVIPPLQNARQPEKFVF